MIQSVERAMALLEAMDAMGRTGVSLGDLASSVGLKAPTAHNLLQTLVALGYVVHDADTRHYALGEKAWVLGHRQFLGDTLAEVAQSVLQKFHRDFNETVVLALYRDGQRHTVATVESGHTLRVGGETGVDDHFYDTATGRVLLSYLEPDAIALFIRDHGLPGEEWPEADTKDALFGALTKIRADRFSFYARSGSHVMAAAVPVRISGHDANVALGLYYPSVRPPQGGAKRLRQHLIHAARDIESRF